MGLAAVGGQPFFFGCVVFFAICTTLAWIFYARPHAPFPG